MEVKFNIPDQHKDRVINALALNHGWKPGSGTTKTQFAKKIILQFIKNNVITYESDPAMETAREQVVQDVDNIGIS